MLQKPTKELPPKPYPDYPLRPHARGKWTKKIKGQSYYFGTWADPYGALQEYEAFMAKNKLPMGNDQPGSTTLYDYLNLFLESRESLMKEGGIVKRTFEEYRVTAKRFAGVMGAHRVVTDLRPADYLRYRQSLVESGLGKVTISNEIVRVRVMVRWIYATYFTDSQPAFGPDFRSAGAASMRKHKAEQTSKLLDRETILAILDESGVHFRAMVLLGINCAYGPSDCARMTLAQAKTAIKTGWLENPRTKTGVDRKAALWPETIEALAASIARRPAPTHDDAKKLCFVAPSGNSYDPTGTGKADLIQGRWKAAKKQARLEHGSFYCLRHTFNTIAERTGDQIAVKTVMGHVDRSMSATYRHEVGDDRIVKVCKTVRDWLNLPSMAFDTKVSPVR